MAAAVPAHAMLDEKSIRNLLPLLEQGHYSPSKKEAIKKLREGVPRGHRAVTRALLASLKNSEYGLLSDIVNALAKVAPVGNEELIRYAARVLGDENSSLRNAGKRALREVASEDRLLLLLKDVCRGPDDDSLSAETTCQLRVELIERPLVEVLGDVATIGHKESIRVLLSWCGNDEVGRSAMVALGRIIPSGYPAYEALIQVIVAQLKGENERGIIGTLRALMEMEPLHHPELTTVLEALLVRGGGIGHFRYRPGQSPIESYTQKVLKKMTEAPVATAAMVTGVTPVRDILDGGMGSGASAEAAKGCAIQ